MPGDDARTALAGSRFADVRWVDQTGSTNADLLAIAAEGGGDGIVLVADHQTAGRGRLGRTWEAPPGSSLLCSTLLRPDLGIEALHLVTMAVGVAASDACESATGVRPRLKWPNDLLVGTDGDERKVAGILAESMVRGGDVVALVVGMGINVNWPDQLPPELASIATALNHHTRCHHTSAGAAVDREGLLVAHLRGLEPLLDALATTEGRDALLDRYRELSATLGREVRVETSTGAIAGRAVDIDAEGHLLVDLAGQLVRVAAGDVVHLRPIG
ncbi:MAG: biotin--[acetyl-CoA-carboxylase] ligase [Acidimicrobiia bacterium]|nr:biotin--[acetyl-CoA-carboxylase] ligase [Acidimicrobiia bacterium]